MKRVLFVAFFFPPIGGAGVQRSLKFVRYLPESGWRATVLTSRARHWMRDESLLAELPPDTRVLRAPFWGGRLAGGGSSPGRGGTAGTRSHARIRLLRLLARSVLVPDAYLGWVAPAGRMARRELARERYDAIFTTSSPDSAHLLGRRLKRLAGIPWVADFRDPWTRRLAYAPPTRLHDALHHRLERACLEEADRVVVTAEETRMDFLARVPGLSPEKIVVIPNGYDEEDFTRAEQLLRASESEIPCAPILHAGQLNPERPIGVYLEGLRLFTEREPARAREAETLFLGGHYDRDREEVERRGLGAYVRFQDGCPHAASVAALLRSRILLLLEQDSDRGRLLLPGKVFEYLRARRPILAVVPRGGAADRLVRECQAGCVVDPSRPESIADGISRLLAAGPMPAAPSIARFERRELAKRLGSVLDAAG